MTELSAPFAYIETTLAHGMTISHYRRSGSREGADDCGSGARQGAAAGPERRGARRALRVTRRVVVSMAPVWLASVCVSQCGTVPDYDRL
jgi:hypothetical protein